MADHRPIPRLRTVSLRLTPPTYERLKRLAIEQGSTVEDVALDCFRGGLALGEDVGRRGGELRQLLGESS